MLSIYKASAGSGKTHTLTGEYLRMLFRDLIHQGTVIPHSHILAVTFTKKATAEMKERILKALFQLSKNPTKSPYYKELINEFHVDQEVLKQNAHKLLVSVLQDFSRFSVSTIDGFFQQVVRTFALDLGLSTTYDLALDNEEIIQQAVDDVFRNIRTQKDDNSDIISWITAFAQHNIDENQKWNPYQSVSGFSQELNKEKLKRNLLKVRDFFANKNNIKDYRKNLEEIVREVIIKTNNLIQEGANAIQGVEGLRLNAISIFKKEAEHFLEKGFNNTTIEVINHQIEIYTKAKGSQQQILSELYSTRLEPIYQQLLTIWEKDRIDYYSAKAILQHLYAVGLIQDVAGQVEQTNKQLGRLPIADINLLIHQIIDGQDTPFIYERMGQYFYHYMIDEFQDTSALQWQNFEPLIQEAEGNNHDNLVVGDVKQSIYRWRNSDWRLLNQIDGLFARTHIPKLECNWRTARLLVEHNEYLMHQYSQWLTAILQDKGWDNYPDAQAIKHIYSKDAIHQTPKKNIPGVVHMQFFNGKTNEIKVECLSAMEKQLHDFQNEGIDLSRVALLVRTRDEAETAAKHLIENGFTVQSSESMRIHSHPAVQLLVALMQQAEDDKSHITNDVNNAIIQDLHAPFTEDETREIKQAANLPLYEYVQKLIHILNLDQDLSALSYLTAFQDKIYDFMQSHVANAKLFLDFWNRKKNKLSIAVPVTSNAIRIMTIHGSKGLEFDIVIIPFLTWPLKERLNHRQRKIIWCEPKNEPFNKMPLVAITQDDKALNTHFKKDYIQEIISQYIDFLNLTYVAFTRPKYRLYTYGSRFEDEEHPQANISNVGQLLSSFLYMEKQTNEQGESTSLLQTNEDGSWSYHIQDPNPDIKDEEDNKGEEDVDKVQTIQACYVNSPIKDRLVLRSRAEDDFTEDTELETIDLGILMHEWLANIITWNDAQPALEKMRITGRITEIQEEQLKTQMQKLQNLLHQENKAYWFDGSMQVINEQTIISTDGKSYRPDRIVIRDKYAEVIDYKFGDEHTDTYQKQLRKYTLLLQEMGYSVNAYIVYTAHQKIQKI